MDVYGGYDDFYELSNRDGPNMFGSLNRLWSMCVAQKTPRKPENDAIKPHI